VFNLGAPLGYYVFVYSVVGLLTNQDPSTISVSDSVAISMNINYFGPGAGGVFLSNIQSFGQAANNMYMAFAFRLNSSLSTSGSAPSLLLLGTTIPTSVKTADVTVMYFGSQKPYTH